MNKIEELKNAKDGLDAMEDIYRYAREGFESIPPADYDRMKWYGLFHRKQTPGFFMMRLRIANGVLTARQIRRLGELTNQFCRGQADLTTRQNLQLRWIRIEDVPAIFAALDEIGIGYHQTGMDNIRNITGCPVSGLDPNELIDAAPIARAIQEGILGRKEFSNLPRKFNISISGCLDDCAISQTHDLGFTPATLRTADGDFVGFNVRVSGAQGGKSTMLSRELDVFLLPDEVVEFCRATLSIFRDHGSRENRQMARLKWLVDEWGIEAFRQEIEKRLCRDLPRAGHDAVRAYGGDHIGVRRQSQPGLRYVGCNVPVGRITGDELIEFARLAESFGSGDLRLTNDQNIVITNVPDAALDDLLAEPLLQRFSPKPHASFRRLVSCTGKDFCHFSLIDTKERAVELADELIEVLPAGFAPRMNWSGCPHACGMHHIADVGLQAARVRVGDEIVDAADVFIGGQLGPGAKLAEKVLDAVPLTELAERLAPLLLELDAARTAREMESYTEKGVLV